MFSLQITNHDKYFNSFSFLIINNLMYSLSFHFGKYWVIYQNYNLNFEEINFYKNQNYGQEKTTVQTISLLILLNLII